MSHSFMHTMYSLNVCPCSILFTTGFQPNGHATHTEQWWRTNHATETTKDNWNSQIVNDFRLAARNAIEAGKLTDLYKFILIWKLLQS
jgi:hypothetical protein